MQVLPWWFWGASWAWVRDEAPKPLERQPPQWQLQVPQCSSAPRQPSQWQLQVLPPGLLGLVVRRAATALAEEAERPPSEPLNRTVVTICPDCTTASHPDFLVMDHVVTQALDDAEGLDLTADPAAAPSPATSPSEPAGPSSPATPTAASSRVARATVEDYQDDGIA